RRRGRAAPRSRAERVTVPGLEQDVAEPRRKRQEPFVARLRLGVDLGVSELRALELPERRPRLAVELVDDQVREGRPHVRVDHTLEPEPPGRTEARHGQDLLQVGVVPGVELLARNAVRSPAEHEMEVTAQAGAILYGFLEDYASSARLGPAPGVGMLARPRVVERATARSGFGSWTLPCGPGRSQPRLPRRRSRRRRRPRRLHARTPAGSSSGTRRGGSSV